MLSFSAIPMATILRNQAETYARSVDALLVERHRGAMMCRNTEEAIRVGLALIDAFETLDAKWRAAVKRAGAQDVEVLRDTGEGLRQVSRILHDARPVLLKCVRAVEADGYAVDGAERYINTVFVPFDERRIDVPLSGEEIGAFVSSVAATAGAKARDLPDAADDDL